MRLTFDKFYVWVRNGGGGGDLNIGVWECAGDRNEFSKVIDPVFMNEYGPECWEILQKHMILICWQILVDKFSKNTWYWLYTYKSVSCVFWKFVLSPAHSQIPIFKSPPPPPSLHINQNRVVFDFAVISADVYMTRDLQKRHTNMRENLQKRHIYIYEKRPTRYSWCLRHYTQSSACHGRAVWCVFYNKKKTSYGYIDISADIFMENDL